jgi:YD repeat-containing protein
MRTRAACGLCAACVWVGFCASPAEAQSSVSYTYDALGRVLTATYPNGSVVTYTYDNAGNRTRLQMQLPANHAPTANTDGPIDVQAGSSVVIDVRANDTDPDNDPLVVTSATTPAKGSAVVTVAGAAVSYSANAGQSGADSFNYTISDGRGGISQTSVALNIISPPPPPPPPPPPNHPPVANPDSRTTAFQTAVSLDPRTNDTDQDGDPLTVTAVTQPPSGQGSASFGSTSVTYTPPAGYSGTTSFGYTISDGKVGGTSSSTVSVTVSPPPPPPPPPGPVANPDFQTVTEGDSILFSPLDNDTGVDPKSIVSISQPPNTDISQDGHWIWMRPWLGYPGTRTINYTMSNANGQSSSTITVSVPARPVPVANPDFWSTPAGTAMLDTPLSNDTGADPKTIISISQPPNTDISTDGYWIWIRPWAGYPGTRTVTYTIQNSYGTSTSTVTVNAY